MFSKLLGCAAIVLSIACFSSVAWIVECSSSSQVERYANGEIKSITEMDYRGQPHGTQTDYFPDGTVEGEYQFHHGTVYGFSQYYPSGKIRVRMVEDADRRVSYEFFEDL